MALDIFPPDVWELVMEKLEESSDILNVFKAFPELEREGLLRKTRVVWLFGQILPFVFPILGKVHVLPCREICREWSRVVDNFLDNHRERQADSYASTMWPPRAPPEGYHLGELYHGNIFCLGGDFRKFKRRFSKLPQGRNPFIGRYIKIMDGESRLSVERERFSRQLLTFVRRFGEHIWFLEVDLSPPYNDPEVFRGALQNLPNLRGLNMNIFNLPECISKTGSVHSNVPSCPGTGSTSPFLPCLETLQLHLTVGPEFLAQLQIPERFQNVRRLSIFYRNWRKGYSNLFPKLTELTIMDMTTKREICEFFNSLNAPELGELTVMLSSCDGRQNYPFDEDIVSWLKRFPRIRSLDFPMTCIGTVTTLIATREIASLTSLTLHGVYDANVEGLSMLRYFPCLEYLVVAGINVMKQPMVEFCKPDEKAVYDLDVWDFLPKLKWISVENPRRSNTVRYTRSRREYLKTI